MKLDSKDTNNIIFADLFGTLLPESFLMEPDQFEEKLDIEFSKLAIFFNNYLSKDNNYLILVSSANHGGPNVLFKVYPIFAKYISEENRKNIHFFVSEVTQDCCEKLGNPMNLETKDGIKITLKFINDKSESVDETYKNLNIDSNKKIFGVGDDVKDVKMLLKILSLGGKIAVVKGKGYICSYESNTVKDKMWEENVNDLITKIAKTEFDIRLAAFLSDYYNVHFRNPKTLLAVCIDNETQKLKHQRHKREKSLKNSYLEKTLNIEELNHILYMMILTQKYIDPHKKKIDKTVKYNDVDEILKLVFSLGNYSVNAPLAYHRNLLTANNITDFFEETKLLRNKDKVKKKKF